MFIAFSFHCHHQFWLIYPGRKHFVGSGFCQISFLSAVFIRFYSRSQSTMIPIPPIISPMWLQGLYPHPLFLGQSAGFFQGPYTQSGISVPIKQTDVSLRYFPVCSGWLSISRALNHRNARSFSFMLPYSWEMILVDISLDCVVSQTPQCGTLVRLLWPFSLMFP